MYECIKKCQVSSQFGDDTNVELGSKWAFSKKEKSFTYDETPQLTKVSINYTYLMDDEGKVIKVTDTELNKYFKVA